MGNTVLTDIFSFVGDNLFRIAAKNTAGLILLHDNSILFHKNLKLGIIVINIQGFS